MGVTFVDLKLPIPLVNRTVSSFSIFLRPICRQIRCLCHITIISYMFPRLQLWSSYRQEG